MTNNYRKAKIHTYMMALQTGKIRGNLMETLEFIWKNSGTTIHEMRTELRIVHQSLTPSVSGLMDCGLVKEIGQVQIKESTYSKFQFVPDSEEQDRLASERLKEKFAQWIKMGLKEYKELMDDDLIKALETE